jgi:hypothetical protein
MARRSGKASRQSRQRRAQRAAAARPSAPRSPAGSPASPTAPAAPEAPADAFATADAAARVAGTTPTGASIRPRSAVSRSADPRFQVAGPSRLSDREIADYHYVVRDLRNIAVLVGVMVVLLMLATVTVKALGIGQA